MSMFIEPPVAGWQHSDTTRCICRLSGLFTERLLCSPSLLRICGYCVQVSSASCEHCHSRRGSTVHNTTVDHIRYHTLEPEQQKQCAVSCASLIVSAALSKIPSHIRGPEPRKPSRHQHILQASGTPYIAPQQKSLDVIIHELRCLPPCSHAARWRHIRN